nr:hypothetical protein [Spiroplasma clarkii]
MMLKKLEQILLDFEKQVKQVKTPADLDNVKSIYAGKDSPLTQVLKTWEKLILKLEN